MLFLSYKKRKFKAEELPHVVYERLKGSYSALLQSGKEGRYSFIGVRPFLLLQKDDKVFFKVDFVNLPGKSAKLKRSLVKQDVFAYLKKVNNALRVEKRHALFAKLPPFVGGSCGFFSYDFGVSMAGIKVESNGPVKTPDVYLVYFDQVIVFDHKKGDIWFLALGKTKADSRSFLKLLIEDYGRVMDKKSIDTKPKKVKGGKIVSNFSREAYVKKIAAVKKFLLNGETYQVNFTQQFSLKTELDPWEVYKKLLKINPSQQACFFNNPKFCVVSSSPERLVSLQNGVVQTEPIKGTVKRGINKTEDKKQIDVLLASKKNNAELSMIVDLARNDIGKVCVVDSVHVVAHRAIMMLSHVIHTYSVVRGVLDKKFDMFDLFKAVFPGGSITGCPKRRTMEIIADLEKTKRGVYCGSAGYFSLNGNMDFNIMIRTFFVRDGRYFFGAGGGIVVDSNADEEYRESVMKAEALKESVVF